MRKHKLYLASPLFNAGELEFNKRLKVLLSPFFDIFLPQEDGELIVELVRSGTEPMAAAKTVFVADIQAIRASDIALIVLDGRVVDEGAAFEVGFAYALGKDCFGFQSDSRRPYVSGNNPMLQCALQGIFSSEIELVDWARQYSSTPGRGRKAT